MRIAFIGQKGIPAKSGSVEKYVERISVRMAEKGHDVFVYARAHYTDPELRAWKGVHIIHVPSIPTKHLDAISHTFFATVHALFHRYDIIHYQAVGPSMLSFIPAMLLRHAQVVSTFHCRDYFHQKWGWISRRALRFGEWVACRAPKKTIVVSKELLEYTKKNYGRHAEFIPNGANISEKAIATTLGEFGLREGRYVLSVGRLVGHKGVHYLIKAFLELEDTNKLPNNTKLVIVGSHANTKDYESYLHLMAKGRENVIFLGERFGRELEELFSHAGLFVQPSESEGMPIVLLESMAHALPTLASDIRVHCEVLSGVGLLFQNKNVADLRDKMAFLLNAPEEGSRLGVAAQNRIRNEYSWDAIAERTLSVYESILPQTKKLKRLNLRKRLHAQHIRSIGTEL
ncbi:MAG: glycosyltransferase family 4 protein [Candidatus Moraniibacteriota bacterium]